MNHKDTEQSAPKSVQVGDSLDNQAGQAELGWLLDDGRLCVGACLGGLKLVIYTNPTAIRFARKQDAEAMIEGLKNLGYPHAHRVRAIEHQWIELVLQDAPALRDCPPDTPTSVGCEARGHVWNNYNREQKDICIVCGAEPKCTDAPIELPARPKVKTREARVGYDAYYDHVEANAYMNALEAALSHAQEQLAGKQGGGGK